MEQFAGVAVAHFLALLVPGVDFLLIVRTSLARGWRSATGVCAGIASANALIITACFTGVSLITRPVVLTVIQGAGGLFLLYVGVAFWRAASGTRAVGTGPAATTSTNWLRNLGLGLMSGLLNPKNILFYASLAAALTGATGGRYFLYGTWMVSVLLFWDVLVAVALGNARALTRLDRALPVITKVSGAFLVAFGTAMLVEVVTGVV
jgi:threonine/homoserine/homoserine lactone efflux protein